MKETSINIHFYIYSFFFNNNHFQKIMIYISFFDHFHYVGKFIQLVITQINLLFNSY